MLTLHLLGMTVQAQVRRAKLSKLFFGVVFLPVSFLNLLT